MENNIYNTGGLFAKAIGLQLSEILYTRRIGIKDFAISIDVPYNQATGYIRGEHAPKWEILIRICNFLHIHIDTLMPVVEEYRPRVASDSGELTYAIDYSYQKKAPMKLKQSSQPQQVTEGQANELQQPTLNDLARAFARRIIKLYQFLTEQQVPHEYNMSRNALNAGTGIGSALLKTDYPQSRDEYFQWISKALDLARDCQYWLALLHDTGYLSEEQAISIQDDLKHIINILWAIIKSRKKSGDIVSSKSTNQ